MNKKNTGNQDEQEKARKLSEDEQKRLEAFEQLSEGMVREGYRRVELTVNDPTEVDAYIAHVAWE